MEPKFTHATPPLLRLIFHTLNGFVPFLIWPLLEGQPGGTSLRFFTSELEVKTPKKKEGRPGDTHSLFYLLYIPLSRGTRNITRQKSASFFCRFCFCFFLRFFWPVRCVPDPAGDIHRPGLKNCVSGKNSFRGTWPKNVKNIFRVDIALHALRP